MVPSWRQIVREVNAASNLNDALALIVTESKKRYRLLPAPSIWPMWTKANMS